MTSRQVDFKRVMIVTQRQHSAKAGLYFKTYPFVWMPIDRVCIYEDDLDSKTKLLNRLEAISADYIDGEYHIKAFGLPKRCMRRNRRHAKYKRDYVSFLAFTKRNGYVSLIEHKNTKQGERQYPAIAMINKND